MLLVAVLVGGCGNSCVGSVDVSVAADAVVISSVGRTTSIEGLSPPLPAGLR